MSNTQSEHHDCARLAIYPMCPYERWARAEIERLRAADQSRVVVHEAEIRRLGIAMGVQADEIERLLVCIKAADTLRARWLNDGHELREPSARYFREAKTSYDKARAALAGKP